MRVFVMHPMPSGHLLHQHRLMKFNTGSQAPSCKTGCTDYLPKHSFRPELNQQINLAWARARYPDHRPTKQTISLNTQKTWPKVAFKNYVPILIGACPRPLANWPVSSLLHEVANCKMSQIHETHCSECRILRSQAPVWLPSLGFGPSSLYKKRQVCKWVTHFENSSQVFTDLKNHYGRQTWYQNDHKGVKLNATVTVHWSTAECYRIWPFSNLLQSITLHYGSSIMSSWASTHKWASEQSLHWLDKSNRFQVSLLMICDVRLVFA